MQNNIKYNPKNKSPLALTKSRFKSLIDEIQTKLKKQTKNYNGQTATSLGLKSPSMNFIERGRILPQFFTNPIRRRNSKQNQMRISINLEFNKLLLNKKNHFVQHSPNSKDLTTNLPMLHMSSMPHHKSDKILKAERAPSRWKLNQRINLNPQFVTESQDFYETKNTNKFKKFTNIQGDNIIQKQEQKDNIQTNRNPQEQKQNKFNKAKASGQNSYRETFLIPINNPSNESKNSTKKKTFRIRD